MDQAKTIFVGDGGKGWDREEAQLGAISFHSLHSSSRGPCWTVACGPCAAHPLQHLKSWARSCKHTVSEKKGWMGCGRPSQESWMGPQGTLAAVLTATTHAVTQTAVGGGIGRGLGNMRLKRWPRQGCWPAPLRAGAVFWGL